MGMRGKCCRETLIREAWWLLRVKFLVRVVEWKSFRSLILILASAFWYRGFELSCDWGRLRCYFDEESRKPIPSSFVYADRSSPVLFVNRQTFGRMPVCSWCNDVITKYLFSNRRPLRNEFCVSIWIVVEKRGFFPLKVACADRQARYLYRCFVQNTQMNIIDCKIIAHFTISKLYWQVTHPTTMKDFGYYINRIHELGRVKGDTIPLVSWISLPSWHTNIFVPAWRGWHDLVWTPNEKLEISVPF